MRNDVKISIVIPIYNVEDYLKECLDSAVNQTLKDIEIICVNDGTKDHSMDIVRKYAENDERIIIIDKENGGASSARNAGIEVAKGEYIFFFDSDDYIRLDALEQLYKEVKENDLDNIYFDAEVFFENEIVRQEQGHYIEYYKRLGKYPGVMSGQELFVAMEKNRDFKPAPWSQLPRKTLILDNNIRFYEGIIHEDNLFSVQCITLAKRVKYLSSLYYFRRIREGSVMTSAQAINSSWGYFICEIELFEFLRGKAYIPEYCNALIMRLSAIQGNAINAIKGVDEKEIEQYLSNKPKDLQVRYRVLAVKNAEYRYHRDMQICDEREKKENLRIQNQKLKEEKEDLCIRNKKLKEEKEDLRIRNQKLEDEKKVLRIWNQKIQGEIAEVRNSYSFRIGKIIMTIPGKIKRLIGKG